VKRKLIKTIREFVAEKSPFKKAFSEPFSEKTD
jgi:hypothetical protein